MRGGSAPLYTLSDAPRNYPGCMLWLRPDLGVTLNGTGVSSLLDYSGNGNNATQSTALNQPVWGAATGPNSTPAMTFDGTRLLSTPAFVPGSAVGGFQQLNAFYVVTPTVIGFKTIVQSGTIGTVGEFGAAVSNPAGFVCRHQNTAGPNVWQSSAIVLGVSHIVEAQHDKSQPTQQIAVLTDGILTAQILVANNGGNDPFANNQLFIGARQNLTTGFIGTMSEIIVFNRLLNAQERSNVYRYLGNRYAITVP